MKPVILITACMYHLARVAQCRETWLAKWGRLIDYKFVFGHGYAPQHDDELVFGVDDSYQGLPAKIQISHKWAIDNGYDFILKTDCDMYVHIPRLLASGFQYHAYSGNFYWPEVKHPFAIGAAYWLNKQASEFLVSSPLPAYPANGGDDMWVGRVMSENEIPHHHDARYHIGDNPDWNTVLTVHTSGPPPISMAEVHAKVGQCV